MIQLMKLRLTVIFSALLLLFSFINNSYAEVADHKYDTCRVSYLLAVQVVKDRYSGATFYESLQTYVPHVDSETHRKLVVAIIKMEYDEPLPKSTKQRDKRIEEFSNWVLMTCLNIYVESN